MIRIDCIWLALGASDLRGGIDKLLAQVVHGFALGAQAHHAYVFANRRADRLKVLVFDGVGMSWVHRRHTPSRRFDGQNALNLTLQILRLSIRDESRFSRACARGKCVRAG